MYGDPPIACHHDDGQSLIDKSRFPSNVDFVEPHLKTAWGTWPVVAAGLSALRLLYERATPDWFVLLSAADYPVMPAGKVLQELGSSPFDAYVDAQPIGDGRARADLHCERNLQLKHFDTPANRLLKWHFYLGAELWFPIIRRKPRLRLGRYTLRLPFEGSHPYKNGFTCFYGDHWFTANAKAAGILLSPTSEHLRLQQHLRMRSQADESYYQTVLCSAPNLSLCLDNKRFAEWNGGGAHPMELTNSELPAALASGAHFARKFTPKAAVLHSIDQVLLR